jgi:threonine dehydrogenase-like Zn-dependent dehydrogenase
MGAQKIFGIELSPYRQDLAKKLNLFDKVLASADSIADEIRELTGGLGVERAFDVSSNDAGRAAAIRAARQWGKIAFVGGRIPGRDGRAGKLYQGVLRTKPGCDYQGAGTVQGVPGMVRGKQRKGL